MSSEPRLDAQVKDNKRGQAHSEQKDWIEEMR